MTDREAAFDAKAYTSETLHAWFISGTPNLHEFMERTFRFTYREGYREAGEAIHKRKDVDRKTAFDDGCRKGGVDGFSSGIDTAKATLDRWLDPQQLLLNAGEMEAGEKRTVLAVLRAIRGEFQ